MFSFYFTLITYSNYFLISFILIINGILFNFEIRFIFTFRNIVFWCFWLNVLFFIIIFVIFIFLECHHTFQEFISLHRRLHITPFEIFHHSFEFIKIIVVSIKWEFLESFIMLEKFKRSFWILLYVFFIKIFIRKFINMSYLEWIIGNFVNFRPLFLIKS